MTTRSIDKRKRRVEYYNKSEFVHNSRLKRKRARTRLQNVSRIEATRVHVPTYRTYRTYVRRVEIARL